jgi:hypothetical protein
MRWPFRGKKPETLDARVSSNTNRSAASPKQGPGTASTGANHRDGAPARSVSLAALQALDRLTVVEHESSSAIGAPVARKQETSRPWARRRATSEPATDRALVTAGQEPAALPGRPRVATRDNADLAEPNARQNNQFISSLREDVSLYSPSGSETDDESVSSDSTVTEALEHLEPRRADPAAASARDASDDYEPAKDTERALTLPIAGRARTPAGPMSNAPTPFAAAWSQRRGPRLDSPDDLWRARSAAWATDTGTLVKPPETLDESNTQANGRTINPASGPVLQATQSYAAARGRTPYPTSFLERRSRSRSRRSRSSSDAGRSRSPHGRAGIRNRDEFLHQLRSCAQPLYGGRRAAPRAVQSMKQRIEALNDLVDWVETQPDAFAPDASVYSAVIILVYEHLAAREPRAMTDEERLAFADDEVFVAPALPRIECMSPNRTLPTFSETTEDTDPWWPQVECAYALLLEFLDPERRDTEVKQQRVAGLVAVSPTSRIDLWECLVPHVLRLFNAPAYEREYVRTCLHRMYARFRDLRTLIRSRISLDLCLPYRFDTRAYAYLVRGLADLLNIVALIVRGLAVPLKKEHSDFYRHALLPLHVPDGYVIYAAELIECAIQFAAREPTLAAETISYLLRHWPVSHTRKEILFLDEMASLLERWQQQQQQKQKRQMSMVTPGLEPAATGANHLSMTQQETQLVQLVFRRLARCMTSAHRDVAEEALLLLLEHDAVRGRGATDGDDDDDENVHRMGEWHQAEPGARPGERDLALYLRQDELMGASRSWFRRALVQYRGFTFSVLADAIRLNARHWDPRIQQMTRQLQTLLMSLDANTYESCLRQHRTIAIEYPRHVS